MVVPETQGLEPSALRSGGPSLYLLPMTHDLFASVIECGCAAKVPPAELRGVLAALEQPARPEILVGPETLDDAGVYRLPDGTCLVQTVDFFPPPAREPYDYGRIAAANALSDVYAMGGKPLMALAIVCMPARLVREGVLREMMRGASDVLREADCVLLGGHSIVDPQPKFGFQVTGVVDPSRMLTNQGAAPGDILVLTKPIGTGVTIMAARACMASPVQERAAVGTMATLNRSASELAVECGGRCATDVTGFGLLGHALQLARASHVAVEIFAEAVPLLEGVRDFAAQGLLSAAAYANRDYVAGAVTCDASVPLELRDLLVDPQTSGGLLVALPPEQARAFLEACKGRVPTPCGVVGRTRPAEGEPQIFVLPTLPADLAPLSAP